MQNQELKLSEKRDFSDVLNASFRFLRQEFKPLFSTVLIYTIIPLIGTSLLSVFYTSDVWQLYFQGLINNASNIETPNFWIYGLIMIVSILSHVLILGITYEYMAMYHKHGRGNFTTSDVIKALAKDFFPIIGYNIITGIVVIIALMFFIIPGIYLMVPLAFIIVIKTVERNNFAANWSRCFQLIKNNWWITFALIIIAFLIMYMASVVLNLPLIIYSMIQGITVAQGGESEINHVSMGIFSLISTIGTSILYVMVYTIIGFQYFSLSASGGSQSILDKINQIGLTESNEA